MPLRRTALAVLLLTPAVALAAPAAKLGESVRGRPIGVARIGAIAAPKATVLVVGCVHGDECAGRAVVALLARATPPPGVRLLLVRDLNPDGFAAGTRQNAHGVDLNRNASRNWRAAAPGDPYYGGPRPFSEPEARAIRTLILRERPALTVWYHQPLTLIDVPYGRPGAIGVSRRYAARVGLPVRDLGGRAGSLSDWENGLRGLGPSFVVELPGGALAAASAKRHAAAILAEARRLAGR